MESKQTKSLPLKYSPKEFANNESGVRLINLEACISVYISSRRLWSLGFGGGFGSVLSKNGLKGALTLGECGDGGKSSKLNPPVRCVWLTTGTAVDERRALDLPSGSGELRALNNDTVELGNLLARELR